MNISSATLEITNICNLNCKHCFNDSYAKIPRIEMDIVTIRSILEDFQRNNLGTLDELWITGGEPLEHSDFYNVMELIYSFGHKSIVVSNGIYDDQKISTLIDTKPYIRRVHLSLEGLKDSTDYIRGDGVFDHLIKKTIPKLKNENFTVCVTVHLRKQNQFEIQQLTELIIDELDCDLKLGILRPIGRAQKNLEDEMLSPEELYECIKVIYEMKKKYNKKRIWHDWEIFTEDIKFYIQDFHGRYSCPAGMQKIIAFTPDCDVYPCVQLRFPFFILGNFKNDKKLDIILGNPSSKKVYKLLQKKSETCIECKYFKVSCHGGCPAIPYGLKEDPFSLSEMDPYCFENLVNEK